MTYRVNAAEEERRGEEGEEAGSVDLIELRSCVLAPFSVPLLFATLDDLMPTDTDGGERQTYERVSGRPGGRASASAPTRAAANCVVVAGQVASSEAHSERAKKRSHLATVALGARLAGEWGLFRAVCVSLIFGTSCAIFPAYCIRVGT